MFWHLASGHISKVNGVKSKVTDDSEEEGPAGCRGFAPRGVLCARTHDILGLLAERGDTS